MKIYKIQDGKTVEEIEVTNFTKNNRDYCFYVKGCPFEYCCLFWINHHSGNDVYHGGTKFFFSLKRY